jgi:hypothetical protein
MLRAERENDELVGKAPLRPEAILASPWPIRSWFWFHIWPSPWLSTLALDAVSRKLTSVMTSVGSSNCPRVCQSGRPGRYSEGRPAGSARTTLPPEASKPAQALMAVIPATMNNTEGKAGRQRRASTSNARLISPKAVEAACRWGAASHCCQPVSTPSTAGSCDAMINSAAACVNPISTGELMRLSSQPNRTKPSTTCNVPVSRASQTASSTQWALPGSARPCSEVPTSS